MKNYRMIPICLLLCLCFSLVASACSPASQPPPDESSQETSSTGRLVDTLPPPRSSSEEDSSPLPESSEPQEPSPSGGDDSKAQSSSSKPASEPPKQTIKITFPEGKTFAQMAEMLEKNGVCTKQQLLDTINSYDYSYYPLVAAQKANEHRCFRLEGYLFPATYEFTADMKPQDVLGKFLRAEEQRITQEDRNRAAQMGYSMDQIITIASLIQGEAGNPEQLAKVSSVIYNRLNIGMKLQLDSTINYVEKSIKPYITGDINRYNSYYNTYKCSGLPAGPICNPGKKWITAALYPADTDYLYFVNDANGNYYFASNYDEHKANCEKAGLPLS